MEARPVEERARPSSQVRARPHGQGPAQKAPIVFISSYPPRLCGVGTFCEEAREFVQQRHPERDALVISHTDGAGEGVIPLIDVSQAHWWRPVVEEVRRLDPYVLHIEHEYGLYEHRDPSGEGDHNRGFLELLSALSPWPTVVEPHTIHGRLCDDEAYFVREMAARADVVLFKCHYQKWRLDWTFSSRGWPTPTNVMVVPHGARPDRRWTVAEVAQLKRELRLAEIPYLGDHFVGLVGWIQRNKRWDILTSMWEEIVQEIRRRTGQEWDLLAAGEMRDPHDRQEYLKYRNQVELLEKKGLAHFYEFTPRGELYYKVMACCDFVVLPTVDETQSGTLARVVALNKPFITTAPMEGLTAQALESGGGLLFSTKAMLRERVITLATDESLRMSLGDNLKKYLDEVASWTVVAGQYDQAYELAREAKRTGRKPVFPMEF
jgi:glycosyltransferase involved in cell wall biosynthesis